MPIAAFVFQALSLLQAISCQSSPRYSAMKYGPQGQNNALDFAGDGGFLYYLSSALLFWQSEADSCLNVNMVPSKQDPSHVRGSLSLLWPVFQSLCFGQLVETLCCAVEGRPVMTETGLSIFEHSLAFAEADAMVSNRLGLGSLGMPKASATRKSNSIQATSDISHLTTKDFYFDSQNTPPEVLLMALISCLNNLSSHVLGVLGLQAKFRLVNTGFWAVCFMSSFVFGFFSFNYADDADWGILRYPTVCIVGFTPHILILVGITICAFIYCIALFLTIASWPTDVPPPQSLKERFQMAHENLRVNIQLSSIHVHMHEDFYTALLKVGFAALAIASEAVYLNEGRRIGVSPWTWLEEERMKEVEQLTLSSDLNHLASPSQFNANLLEAEAIGTGERGSPMSQDPTRWTSGYSREWTTKILKDGPNHSPTSRIGPDGVGVIQRRGRYAKVWEFFTGIFWLITGWFATSLAKALRKVGITHRPSWLRRVSGKVGSSQQQQTPPAQPQASSLDFWMLSDEGILSLPQDENVDVGAETKKRLQIASDSWDEQEERKLDSTLYSWWTHGGWWGERDDSGEYEAPTKDDDTTSMISLSTDQSEQDWESESLSSSQRTPTQRAPYRTSCRSSSPIANMGLDSSQLARLLDPKDLDSRQEARILAHHLSSDRIVTRSQHRRAQSYSKAHLLTSTRYRPLGFNPSSLPGRLLPHEEAELLEHLILSRRSNTHTGGAPTPEGSSTGLSDNAAATSWRDGAEGLGSNGPQCVVCQSSPRTVLAWPCRCLSLCEDCRITLANNNFATCVCCRQDVVGFSRLFVP